MHTAVYLSDLSFESRLSSKSLILFTVLCSFSHMRQPLHNHVPTRPVASFVRTTGLEAGMVMGDCGVAVEGHVHVQRRQPPIYWFVHRPGWCYIEPLWMPRRVVLRTVSTYHTAGCQTAQRAANRAGQATFHQTWVSLPGASCSTGEVGPSCIHSIRRLAIGGLFTPNPWAKLRNLHSFPSAPHYHVASCLRALFLLHSAGA